MLLACSTGRSCCFISHCNLNSAKLSLQRHSHDSIAIDMMIYCHHVCSFSRSFPKVMNVDSTSNSLPECPCLWLYSSCMFCDLLPTGQHSHPYWIFYIFLNTSSDKTHPPPGWGKSRRTIYVSVFVTAACFVVEKENKHIILCTETESLIFSLTHNYTGGRISDIIHN